MASGNAVCVNFVEPISTLATMVNLVSRKPNEIFGFGLVPNSTISEYFNRGLGYYNWSNNYNSFCLARWCSNTAIDCLVISEWRDFLIRYNPTTQNIDYKRPLLDATDTFTAKAYSYGFDSTDFDTGQLIIPWFYAIDDGDWSTSYFDTDDDGGEYIGSLTRISAGSQYMPISSATYPRCFDSGMGACINPNYDMIHACHYDGSGTYTTSGTARVSVCFLRKNYSSDWGHK